MNGISILKWLGALFIMGALLLGCGISRYPGQPGMVTNGYSKIDVENLDASGLYVYEVSYDNSEGGAGVGVIVTKYYPTARTFTTNVRTNAEGTLFRHKAQYNGAEVQMISIPKLNQIILPPGSNIVIMLEYELSLDEVDDKNVAEEFLFKPENSTLHPQALSFQKFRWDLIRAAEFGSNGRLIYTVEKVQLEDKVFVPSQAIQVQTSLSLNGVRTNFLSEMSGEVAEFIETNFPKGYKGAIQFFLKGVEKPLTLHLGIHTVKTAEAAGIKISHDVSSKQVEKTLKRFGITLN